MISTCLRLKGGSKRANQGGHLAAKGVRSHRGDPMIPLGHLQNHPSAALSLEKLIKMSAIDNGTPSNNISVSSVCVGGEMALSWAIQVYPGPCPGPYKFIQ